MPQPKRTAKEAEADILFSADDMKELLKKNQMPEMSYTVFADTELVEFQSLKGDQSHFYFVQHTYAEDLLITGDDTPTTWMLIIQSGENLYLFDPHGYGYDKKSELELANHKSKTWQICGSWFVYPKYDDNEAEKDKTGLFCLSLALVLKQALERDTFTNLLVDTGKALGRGRDQAKCFNLKQDLLPELLKTRVVLYPNKTVAQTDAREQALTTLYNGRTGLHSLLKLDMPNESQAMAASQPTKIKTASTASSSAVTAQKPKTTSAVKRPKTASTSNISPPLNSKTSAASPPAPSTPTVLPSPLPTLPDLTAPLRQEIERLQIALQNQNAINNTLQAENAQLQRQNAAQAQQTQSWSQQYHNSQQTIVQLQGQLTVQFNDYSTQIKALQGNLALHKSAQESWIQENDHAKQTITELIAQSATDKQKLENAKTELNQALNELKGQYTAAQEKIQSLEATQQTNSALTTQLKQQLQDTEKQATDPRWEALQFNLRVPQATLEANLNAWQRLTEENLNAWQRLTEACPGSQKLAQQIQKTIEEINKILESSMASPSMPATPQSAPAAALHTQSNSQEPFHDTAAQIAQLTSTNTTLIKQVETLTAQLADTQQELTQAQQKQKQASMHNQSTPQERFQQFQQADHAVQLQSANTALKSQVEGLKQQLTQSQEALATATKPIPAPINPTNSSTLPTPTEQRLRTERNQAQQEIVALKQQLKQLATSITELNQLREDHQVLLKNSTALSALLNVHEADKTALQKELKEAQDKHSALKAQFEHLTALVERLKNTEITLEQFLAQSQTLETAATANYVKMYLSLRGQLRKVLENDAKALKKHFSEKWTPTSAIKPILDNIKKLLDPTPASSSASGSSSAGTHTVVTTLRAFSTSSGSSASTSNSP